jgi:type II secretory pathway pseudopilin PulG
MTTCKTTERGATIIEVILTVAILGIVIAGPIGFLANIIDGFIFERNISAAEENIQAALTRITHEVANMDTKRSYTFGSSSITYYYKNNAAQTTILLSGTNILLDGNILLNNVLSGTGFAVTAPNYIASPATPAGITIRAQVTGADKLTVTKTYTARIELNTQRFQ